MRDTWAAEVQCEYDGGDDVLDTLARRNHRTVVHWWGRRIEGGKARALCYVCDTYIATWAAKYPPTVGAVTAILKHRREHLISLSKPTLTIGGKA